MLWNFGQDGVLLWCGAIFYEYFCDFNFSNSYGRMQWCLNWPSHELAFTMIQKRLQFWCFEISTLDLGVDQICIWRVAPFLMRIFIISHLLSSLALRNGVYCRFASFSIRIFADLLSLWSFHIEILMENGDLIPRLAPFLLRNCAISTLPISMAGCNDV